MYNWLSEGIRRSKSPVQMLILLFMAHANTEGQYYGQLLEVSYEKKVI